jgi:predicted transcriptional regulator
MSALSLRLSDDLAAKLMREARVEGRPRSEVAREAIAEYIARRDKERLLAGMIEAAQSLATDAAARRESLEIANALADDGLDDVLRQEQAAGTAPDDKWWK